MTTQPEALRLADDLDQCHAGHVYEGPTIFSEAAAELRRLHEVNRELLEAFKLIVEVGDRAATEISRDAISKVTGEQA